MDAYVMTEHLKRMFEGKAHQERFDTSKSLYACKQGDRDPGGPHVLKMIGLEAQIDLNLQSLNIKYAWFVMNYNMNKINKTLIGVLVMFKTTETNIQNASPPLIMMVNKWSAKAKGKLKRKKRMGFKSIVPKTSPKQALNLGEGVTKGDTCHYYKKSVLVCMP
ncbi:uncharacterized protein LOC141690462 [Apium graveolens]|uniref:uncharacterized protein LOC141690462 n=1 Tax=Apium graveolens TaxID=4045 RepID=UPI003D78BF62